MPLERQRPSPCCTLSESSRLRHGRDARDTGGLAAFMAAPSQPPSLLRIGVDVGGTFTDLVAFDGQVLRVVKVPSTPPDFHRAVIEAVHRAAAGRDDIEVVHG